MSNKLKPFQSKYKDRIGNLNKNLSSSPNLQKIIENSIKGYMDNVNEAFNRAFKSKFHQRVLNAPQVDLSHIKKPQSYEYGDMLWNEFQNIKLPQIERDIIPSGPIIIEPLPGQIREGGKLRDLFTPEFPPMIIPRSPPIRSPPTPSPFYELGPGEAFAQTSIRPSSWRRLSQGFR